MEEVKALYDALTAIIMYISSILVVRYVFLYRGFKGKADEYFHFIACSLTVLVCVIFGHENGLVLCILATAIYLFLNSKKYKIAHTFLVLVITGIVDGLITPFTDLPLNVFFVEVSEDVAMIYQLIIYIFVLLIFVGFFIFGRKWREKFRLQLGERGLKKWEMILLCAVGVVLLLYSGIISENMANEFATDEKSEMFVYYRVALFIASLSAFFMDLSVIIVVMVQNKRAYYFDKVTDMQFNIIVTMAEIVENRDENTGGHIKRTATYVEIIAKQLKKNGEFKDILTDAYIKDIIVAAPLHDIGKIHVSDVVLNKPGRLTEEEFAMMKTHAAAGRDLLKKAKTNLGDFKYLDIATEMAGYHHEWWDGSAKGYPYGIKGEDIPLSARIMAVADVFDALTSKRIYKEPMPVEKAYSIIKEESGTHFDTRVVNAFFDASTKVEKALNEFLNDHKNDYSMAQ